MNKRYGHWEVRTFCPDCKNPLTQEQLLFSKVCGECGYLFTSLIEKVSRKVYNDTVEEKKFLFFFTIKEKKTTYVWEDKEDEQSMDDRR